VSELLGTTIEELIATMKERRVRIPSEIGAFIALEVCESLLDGPASVRLADVRVAEDGTISVFAPPGSATSDEAARSIVALLGSLLVAAGTGVPRVLVGLLEEGPTSGRWDLSSLRDDLEASLVPLNRAAARRVLARMLRETQRPRSEAPSSRPPGGRGAPGDPTLDDQLDDLLSADAMPGDSDPPSEEASLDAELDATLADYDGSHVDGADRTIAEDSGPSFEDEPTGKQRRPRSDAPTSRRAEDDSTLEPRRGLDLEALGDELDRSQKKSNPLPWVLAFVAIVAAAAAGLALLRPDLVDAMLGRPPAPEEPEGPTAEDQERLDREHRALFGTLEIVAQPPESQVLMFVGRGPAEAEELPVGMAHEFVAIADGRAPTRAYVPADATWEEGEGGPRYELALQAGTAEMATADLALGETTLPRDAMGAAGGSLGTVRVITNPPGAKVYVLIGFSPRVIVENIRTDEVVELLVFHDGHPVSTEVVPPSAWEQNPDGSKHASIEITLEGYDPEAEE